MNRAVRRVAIACLLLFAALLVNANVRQTVLAQGYRDNPGNSRVLEQTYDRERGAIALDDGTTRTLIARSTERDGRFRYLRSYPSNDLYAHVSGFYSFIYGATGIEKAEDSILTGDDPSLFVKRFTDTLTGREPRGGDVVLTIDPAVQRAAYAGLRGLRGAAVALDPKTGAILAMVSAPSYDPNSLTSFDGTAIRAAYDGLTKDPANPLLNRAINQTYPPGSTFKVVTAAAALADGRTPESQVPSPTVLDLPQTSVGLKNFGGESCGGPTSSIAEALRISCNTAFAALGLQLGAQKLRDQAKAFGLDDDSLTVPLPVSASRFPDDPNPPQLAQSAIGQFDVRVTPLQMAMVAAGIANGGEVMSPYLVQEVQAPDLSRIDLAQPKALSRATTPRVADELTTMMQAVVDRGTGTSAQIPGVAVAGKTGTAQNAPGAAPHAWFIAFAPAKDPKIAVAVLVENGGKDGSDATGGRVAGPIAKAMMQAVLKR